MKLAAEFRGPGVRHRYDESGDDFELDMDQRTRGLGGRPGRIILLGDGTEVLTDSDEHEMVDQDEEDKDLESQAGHGQSSPEKERSEVWGEREQTPGPEPTVQSPEALKATPYQPPSKESTTTSNGSETTTKPAFEELSQAPGKATD